MAAGSILVGAVFVVSCTDADEAAFYLVAVSSAGVHFSANTRDWSSVVLGGYFGEGLTQLTDTNAFHCSSSCLQRSNLEYYQ